MFTHLLISIVISATTNFNSAESNTPCVKPDCKESKIESMLKPVTDLIGNLELPKVDYKLRDTPDFD